MKDGRHRYTIGEVAALLNISPQTLRFYDKSGVVVPDCTDQKTGYRYYSYDQISYISRVKYGGYDTPVKTMLERAIPVQQAFLRIWQGETHHVQRRVAPKEAVIIGYGTLSAEEKAVFSRLAGRNAKNMCFEKHRVVFALEEELEDVVRNEVLAWQRS